MKKFIMILIICIYTSPLYSKSNSDDIIIYADSVINRDFFELNIHEITIPNEQIKIISYNELTTIFDNNIENELMVINNSRKNYMSTQFSLIKKSVKIDQDIIPFNDIKMLSFYKKNSGTGDSFLSFIYTSLISGLFFSMMEYWDTLYPEGEKFEGGQVIAQSIASTIVILVATRNSRPEHLMQETIYFEFRK